jgi:hypothetical protein
MTDREALRWAIGALVEGVDLPASIVAVELMRCAARLIAGSGALPHRCDRASALFRQMIAAEAAGAPFPVTDEMIAARRDVSGGRHAT